MARCSRDECQRWRPDLLVRRRRAGCQFEGHWYCSTECLEHAASERLYETSHRGEWPAVGPRIGSLLVHQRALTKASLQLALRDQAVTRLPLGQQLEHMGLVTPAEVLRALSQQAGVSYLATIDVSRIRHVSEPLSSATLRELGLIALNADPDNTVLRVACKAPVPWPSLRAITSVTGWSTEPLLIADRDWDEVTQSLAEREQAQAIPVSGVDAAAAATAQLAEATHAREMSMARFDPYILVRVESRDHHEDLLLHMEGSSKEATCLVASTLR